MKMRLILSLSILVVLACLLASCAIFGIFNQSTPVVEEGLKGFFKFIDPVSHETVSIAQMTPPATFLIQFEYDDLFKPSRIELEGFQEGFSSPLFSSGTMESDVATALFKNSDLYGTVTFVSQVRRSEYLGGGIDRYQKSIFIADDSPATVSMDCFSQYFTLSTLAEPQQTTDIWFEIRLHDEQTAVFDSLFELELAVEGFYFIINGRSYIPTISAGDRFYLYNSGKDAVILLREEFVNPGQYFFPGVNEIRVYFSDNHFFDQTFIQFSINNPDFTPPDILELSADPNTVEISYTPEYDFVVTDEFVVNLHVKDKIQPYLAGLYNPVGIKYVEFAIQDPGGNWTYTQPTSGFVGSNTQELEMNVTMAMKDASGVPLPDGIYSLYARAEDNNGNVSTFERFAVFKFGTTPFVPLEVKAFKRSGTESNRFMYGDYAEFQIVDELNLTGLVWSVAPALNPAPSFVPKSADHMTVYWDDMRCFGDYRVIVNGTTASGKNAYGEVLIKVLVGNSPEWSFSFNVADLKKPYDPFTVTFEDQLVGLGLDLENIITDVEVTLMASGMIVEPLDISCIPDRSMAFETKDGVFTKVSYQCVIDRLLGPIENYELKEHEEVRVVFTFRNYIGNSFTGSVRFSGR